MASFLKHCCDRTWQKCQPCSDIIITLSCSLILSAFSYFRTVAILKLKYNWNVFTEDDTLCKRRLASALDNKLELQLCSSTLIFVIRSRFRSLTETSTTRQKTRAFSVANTSQWKLKCLFQHFLKRRTAAELWHLIRLRRTTRKWRLRSYHGIPELNQILSIFSQEYLITCYIGVPISYYCITFVNVLEYSNVPTCSDNPISHSVTASILCSR